jgi:hypothetical protein
LNVLEKLLFCLADRLNSSSHSLRALLTVLSRSLALGNEVIAAADPLPELIQGHFQPVGRRRTVDLCHCKHLSPQPHAAITGYKSDLSKKFLALVRMVL